MIKSGGPIVIHSNGDWIQGAPVAGGASSATISGTSYSDNQPENNGLLPSTGRGIVMDTFPQPKYVENGYYICWSVALSTDEDDVDVTLRVYDETNGQVVTSSEGVFSSINGETLDISDGIVPLSHKPQMKLQNIVPVMIGNIISKQS